MKLFSKMKKRLAKKRLSKRDWRRYQSLRDGKLVIPTVGMLVNDCDGFNHLVPEVKYNFQSFSRGRILEEAWVHGGTYGFCSCMDQFKERAWTVEMTQQWHDSTLGLTEAQVQELRNDPRWSEKDELRHMFFRNGGRCCDELGQKSKEYADFLDTWEIKENV